MSYYPVDKDDDGLTDAHYAAAWFKPTPNPDGTVSYLPQYIGEVTEVNCNEACQAFLQEQQKAYLEALMNDVISQISLAEDLPWATGVPSLDGNRQDAGVTVDLDNGNVTVENWAYTSNAPVFNSSNPTQTYHKLQFNYEEDVISVDFDVSVVDQNAKSSSSSFVVTAANGQTLDLADLSKFFTWGKLPKPTLSKCGEDNAEKDTSAWPTVDNPVNKTYPWNAVGERVGLRFGIRRVRKKATFCDKIAADKTRQSITINYMEAVIGFDDTGKCYTKEIKGKFDPAPIFRYSGCFYDKDSNEYNVVYTGQDPNLGAGVEAHVSLFYGSLDHRFKRGTYFSQSLGYNATIYPDNPDPCNGGPLSWWVFNGKGSGSNDNSSDNASETVCDKISVMAQKTITFSHVAAETETDASGKCTATAIRTMWEATFRLSGCFYDKDRKEYNLVYTGQDPELGAGVEAHVSMFYTESGNKLLSATYFSQSLGYNVKVYETSPDPCNGGPAVWWVLKGSGGTKTTMTNNAYYNALPEEMR